MIVAILLACVHRAPVVPAPVLSGVELVVRQALDVVDAVALQRLPAAPCAHAAVASGLLRAGLPYLHHPAACVPEVVIPLRACDLAGAPPPPAGVDLVIAAVLASVQAGLALGGVPESDPHGYAIGSGLLAWAAEAAPAATAAIVAGDVELRIPGRCLAPADAPPPSP